MSNITAPATTSGILTHLPGAVPISPARRVVGERASAARSVATPWALAALALGVCVYAAFPNALPDLTPFNCDDSEAYIGLGNAIATGRGYTRCLNPDQYLTHKTWPPGLPLLLAPVIRAFGPDLLALKLLMCGVGVAGLVLLYLLVRDLTDARLAGWVTIATACSAHYFWFSHQVMAEVPMFTASVAALWLLQRAMAEPSRWRWWCLAGLVVGYGAVIKGLILLLVPASLVGLRRVPSANRRRVLLRYAAFAAIAVIPTAAWAVRNSRVQAASLDGINQFRMILQQHANDPHSRLVTPAFLVHQVYENVAWGLIYRIPNQVLPLVRLLDLRQRAGGQFVAVGLAGLTIALLVTSAWRRRWPVHAYVAAMLALLAVFNTGGTARYFVPLAPLCLFLAAVAVRDSRWWARLGRAAPVVACLWLFLAGADLAAAIHQQVTFPYRDRLWPEFVDAAQRARQLVPSDATVYVHNANAFALVSGRRTWISQPGVPFDLGNAFERGCVTHLVVSRHTRLRDAGSRRWAHEHRDLLQRLGGNAGYEVFAYAGEVRQPTRP